MDLVIGKLLLMLFAWDMYLIFTGYSHIEYKGILDAYAEKWAEKMS